MGHMSMILENALQEAFLYILNRSIGGAFVILLVMLARLLLRRAPRKLMMILWAAAALRLLLPFSIASTYSPVPVTADPVPSDIGMMLTPEIDTGITSADNAVNALLPPPDPTGLTSVNPMQIVIFASSVLWLIGVILFAAADGISLYLLRRRLRHAENLDDGIWRCSSVSSPFVWGIIRPGIYLPAETSEEALPYILAHERMHIRRGDMLWKALGCVILTLHWFNPLVWLAFHFFAADMETACDEAVLREAEDDIRIAYSEALLSVAAGRKIHTAFPPAFGESNPKRRIRDVLAYRNPSGTVLIPAVLITVVICIGCAFSRSAEEVLPSGLTDTETEYAVVFPAYSDIRTPANVTFCAETAPFTVSVTLPAGWSIGAPQTYTAPLFSPLASLLSPLCIYENGERIGSIGFYPIENDLSGDGGNEHFIAFHRLMMGNATYWDSESWKLIREDGSMKAGYCTIQRRLDAWNSDAAVGMMGAAMPVFTSAGIGVYDTEKMVMAALGVEPRLILQEDGNWRAEERISTAQLEEIAASLTITPGGEQTEWNVPRTQYAQITFPAYQGGRTAANASIYDTAPFTLTMELPLGWKLLIPGADAQTADLPFTPVTIRWGNETIASVGFMTFRMYEGITPQDDGFYRMVYNQLMSNLVTWDKDYTPIESTRTETFCAATCRILSSVPEEGVPAAGWKRTETEGILAYDTELGVYIAMSYRENAVDEETWQSIAASIRLAPHEE